VRAVSHLCGFYSAICLTTEEKARTFSTVSKPARSLSQINPVHAAPNIIQRISTLSLFSHLRLGLPRGSFPSDYLNKTLYASLLSPIRAISHANFILLDLITRIMRGEEYNNSLSRVKPGASKLRIKCYTNLTFKSRVSYI
jgi:hypothetical protein